ncbi:MAG: ATP-dependent zinc metalloprotease FtsH [Chitinivibrionales bacterium]|nr:ATP-dependent zinc metalloprotease FtsH [Chitinivibrionales bacterium]MBD3356554.1 ATP-dependent zinc metalloprotease FtsH [Chitinivibrionales bacterium]
MNEGKRPSTSRGQPGPSSSSPEGAFGLLIWILIFAVLFYFMTRPFESEQSSIPFSQFLDEVEQGNVSRIMARGDEISGEFVSDSIKTITTTGDTVRAKSFVTTRPSFAEPDLMPLLREKGVIVDAETTDPSMWTTILIFAFPWLLLIGYLIYAGSRIRRQIGGHAEGIFGVGKSTARRFRQSSKDIHYSDIAGLENAKRDLAEIVDYLRDPKRFTGLGAQIPRGVLLMGAPGTGKTLLARATAGEAEVPFFSISGSEFIELFVGVGASRVRKMFEEAKKLAPSIIFIDEIDSVGRIRGTGIGGGQDEREQTLNQILSEMDGFEPHESVIVIAATNRPDVLDPALTRPGRFDRQIALDLPQRKARLEILKIHTRSVPLSADVDLDVVAARTVGFSGADLRNLVNEAALLAGRKKKNKVDSTDLDDASDKILLGAEREDLMNEQERKTVAYHEAGHALVAKLLPETDPLQKVTIIARGRTLGATEQVPETERHNLNRDYLLSRIAVALGGRASELLVFGQLSNGAANDLHVVTAIARKMVCEWGMSDRLGPATFTQSQEHPFLGRELAQPREFSETTTAIIDEEIQKLLRDMHERAWAVLHENREQLDRLAVALLEHETLMKEDIDRIVGVGNREKEAVPTGAAAG